MPTYSVTEGNVIYNYKTNLPVGSNPTRAELEGVRAKLLNSITIDSEGYGKYRGYGSRPKQYVEQDSNAPQQGNSAFSKQITDYQNRQNPVQPTITQSSSRQPYTSSVEIVQDTTNGRTLAPYSRNPDPSQLVSREQTSTSRFQPIASSAQYGPQPEGAVTYSTAPVMVRQTQPTSQRRKVETDILRRKPNELVSEAIQRIGVLDAANRVVTRQSTPFQETTGVAMKTLSEFTFRGTQYNLLGATVYSATEPPLRKVQSVFDIYSRQTRDFNSKALPRALQPFGNVGATGAELGSGAINEYRQRPTRFLAETGLYAVGGELIGPVLGRGAGAVSNLAGRTAERKFGIATGLKAAKATERAFAGVGLGVVALTLPKDTRKLGAGIIPGAAFGSTFGPGYQRGLAKAGTGIRFDTESLARIDSKFNPTNQRTGFVQVSRATSDVNARVFGKPRTGQLEDFSVNIGSRTRSSGENVFRGQNTRSVTFGNERVVLSNEKLYGAVLFGQKKAQGIFLEPDLYGRPVIAGRGREVIVETGEPVKLFSRSQRNTVRDVDEGFFSRRDYLTKRRVEALSSRSTVVSNKGVVDPYETTNFIQDVQKRSYREALFTRPGKGEFVLPESFRVKSEINTAVGFEVGKSRTVRASRAQIIKARNIAIRAGAAIPDYNSPSVKRQGVLLRNRAVLDKLSRTVALKGKKGNVQLTSFKEPKYELPKVQETLYKVKGVNTYGRTFKVPRSPLTVQASAPRVFAIPKLKIDLLSQTKTRAVNRQLLSQRQVQITSTRSVQNVRQIPQVDLTQRIIPAQRYVQRPAQTQRQVQRQITTRSLTRSFNTGSLTYRSPPPPPPVKPGFLGGMPSLIGLKARSSVGSKNRNSRYVADLFSSAFKIKRKSKREGLLAASLGFGIRGG